MGKELGVIMMLSLFLFPFLWKEKEIKSLEMEVTAYCPCKKCCGKYADGITASGEPVSANGGKFVAADPSLPFKTLVSVTGYAKGKWVPVLDRGGAIKGNKIDVFFPTHEEALNWGRQKVIVHIQRKKK